MLHMLFKLTSLGFSMVFPRENDHAPVDGPWSVKGTIKP